MKGEINMKFLIKAGIYAGLFACSTGATFLIASNRGSSTATSRDTAGNPTELGGTYAPLPETAGQRLLSSVMGYEGIELNGNLGIELGAGVSINLDLNGKGSIQDIEDIKLLVDYNAKVSGIDMAGQIGYFADTLTFSVKDKAYFYLEKADLMDFVEMIPNYGFSIELPDAFKNIDAAGLLEKINKIDVEDRKTIDDGNSYFYTFTLGEGEGALPLYIVTDLEDNFLGIRTDTFTFKGTTFSLNVSLKEIIGDLGIANPRSDEIIGPKYINFKPAFGLFDAVMNLTKKQTIGANLTLDIKKDVEGVKEDFLAGNLDLNMDLNNKKYGIRAKVDEHNRSHVLNFNYVNDTIYASFHKVKVSLEKSTVSDLINYALTQIGEDTINELMNKLTSMAGSIDLESITSNLYSSFASISLNDEELALGVDLNPFNVDSKFNVVLNFANKQINSISITNLVIKDYVANVAINFADYVDFSVNPEEYTALEPASTLVQAIMNMIPQKQFRFELNGSVDDKDDSTKPVNFDGGFQFDLNDKLGYGEIDIVDKKNYNHNIKVEEVEATDFKFAYNDTLYGKFDSNTVSELIDLIKGIITEPDDHFIELFGDLLEKIQNSPLMQGINGDYGLLLEYEYISNLKISETQLSMDFSLALVGFDDTFHIEINYSGDPEKGADDAKIESARISDLELLGMEVNLDVDVKDWDESKDAERLSNSHSEARYEYMDFSNIKTLFALGIKTSKYNYYHFSADLDLQIKTKLLGIGGSLATIPVDIKVLTVHGDVKVAAEFTSLPIVAVLTPSDYASAKDRKASIYWHDNTFYVYRTEQGKKKGFLGIGTGDYHAYEVYGKYDNEYFLDNVLDILLNDVLSVGDTISGLIDNSVNNSSDNYQMRYEKLLKSFHYSKSDGVFTIGLDLNEMTGKSMFDSTTLKVFEDKSNGILKGIDATVVMSFGLNIIADVSIDLLDDYVIDVDNGKVKLDKMDAYMLAHESDTLNVRYAKYNGSNV